MVGQLVCLERFTSSEDESEKQKRSKQKAISSVRGRALVELADPWTAQT